MGDVGFLFVASNIYFISYSMVIIYIHLNVELFIDASDMGIIVAESNLRNFYSRCRGRLCWNTVEEQV